MPFNSFITNSRSRLCRWRPGPARRRSVPVVVAEEQLLQRRRLAGQRDDPVRPELGEQRTDPLRGHLATQSVPVDLHSADPRQAVERRWAEFSVTSTLVS